MQVSDLMTTEVVAVPADATLAVAVEQMLKQSVGSVIVTHDGDPAGIVTESDALRAALLADAPFEAIPVAKVTSRPLTTITPHQTVRAAIETMVDAGVKKLPVVDGYELVGIVTLADVAWHFSDIRKEATSLLDNRQNWESKT